MKPDRFPPPRPAPDPLADDSTELLDGGFAPLWQAQAQPPQGHLRERLLERVLRSAQASRAFVTRRRADLPALPLADGVQAQTLYEAAGSPGLRPGEPRRARLLTLAPGARWPVDAAPAGERVECLVLRGEVGSDDGPALGPLDFQLWPAADLPATLQAGAQGALLLWREAPAMPGGEASPLTQGSAVADWVDYAPGIRRRVLWQQGDEAAMLYHALPGAAVPRHHHHHDEECLMIDGEIFLDEVLLRPGEYQIAPAGTTHGGVSTDTGGILYAHGDLDLDVQPE